MIIGIGNDLIDRRRIERTLAAHGVRFEMRCFTQAERSKAAKRRAAGGHIDVYAKRFAAKEACAKALGTGISDDVYLKDIGVREDSAGRPFLELTNGALGRLKSLIPEGYNSVLHLSLTDEKPYAQAFVVIEAVRKS